MRFIQLVKGKPLRKHSLPEKTAASVLLKLFISGNECCHVKALQKLTLPMKFFAHLIK